MTISISKVILQSYVKTKISKLSFRTGQMSMNLKTLFSLFLYLIDIKKFDFPFKYTIINFQNLKAKKTLKVLTFNVSKFS